MTDLPKATFRQKWGDDWFSSRGFIQFPSALLEFAGHVGLSAPELSVILALLYWKFSSSTPYPSVATIAAQINKDARTVQRTLRALEDRGWIKITTAYHPDGSQGANLIDFTPLRSAINKHGRLGLPAWALDKLPPQDALPFSPDDDNMA